MLSTKKNVKILHTTFKPITKIACLSINNQNQFSDQTKQIHISDSDLDFRINKINIQISDFTTKINITQCETQLRSDFRLHSVIN